MDLSALGSSLPPGLAETEREMGDKFRASALSITTLYKSALAATKQAYTVGYTSCLSDVLEIVQNSLSENPENGQDAGRALSRLMDWADARKVALQAFESDEEREEGSSIAKASATSSRPIRPASAQPVGGISKGTSSGPRSSLPSHMAQSAPARPSSAPLTPVDHDRTGPRGRSAEPALTHQAVAGPSRLNPDGLQTPAPVQRNSRYQPTPSQIPSSSPNSASTSNLFPPTSLHTSPSFSSHQARSTKHLPRHSLGSLPSADNHHPPSTANFAPAIGLEDVPFVAFPNAHQGSPVLETNFTLGNKRPLSSVFPGGDEMTGVEETTPPLVRSSSASGRGGRRKGTRPIADDAGGDERERKRASRRAGGGGGGSGGL